MTESDVKGGPIAPSEPPPLPTHPPPPMTLPLHPPESYKSYLKMGAWVRVVNKAHQVITAPKRSKTCSPRMGPSPTVHNDCSGTSCAPVLLCAVPACNNQKVFRWLHCQADRDWLVHFCQWRQHSTFPAQEETRSAERQLLDVSNGKAAICDTVRQERPSLLLLSGSRIMTAPRRLCKTLRLRDVACSSRIHNCAISCALRILLALCMCCKACR